MRSIYRKIDGVWAWYPGDTEAAENMSAAVLDDTIPAIKHPATGEFFESRSAYMRENKRLGLTVVGNDFLGQRGPGPTDKVTEPKIMEAIQKAEAIQSDPARRNEMRYKNERILDQFRRQGVIRK